MKKILFISVLFFSCDGDKGENSIPYGNKTIQTIEHEGCEYVYLRRYGSVSITHKGNCKNKIHTFNLYTSEIIEVPVPFKDSVFIVKNSRLIPVKKINP